MVPVENFRDIEIFQCVAEHRSFSAAARELQLTQPAVSVAIARLERQLGTTLFNRQCTGGGSEFITPTGQLLVAHAARIVAEINRAVDMIVEAEGRRPVRIGLPPLITRHFFPDGLKSLVEAYGMHPIELVSFGSERMYAELEHHTLDVGLIASAEQAINLPRIKAAKVASFPFCAALPERVKTASEDHLGINELESLDEMVISFTDDYVQRAALNRLFARNGKSFEVDAETDRPEMMERMVSAGVGVGVAASIAFENVGGVRILPITGDDMPTFNVFVFEDTVRSVRPEAEVVTAVKKVLFEATKKRDDHK